MRNPHRKCFYCHNTMNDDGIVCHHCRMAGNRVYRQEARQHHCRCTGTLLLLAVIIVVLCFADIYPLPLRTQIPL